MKRRSLKLECLAAALMLFSFGLILSVTSAFGGPKSVTYSGTSTPPEQDLKEGIVDSDTSIVLTTTERKPGIYTVTGTLYLRNKQVACPIKGTYYGESLVLKATAYHPELRYNLDVDGEKRPSYSSSRDIMDITISDPKSNIAYFRGPVVGRSNPPKDSSGTEIKPPVGTQATVDTEEGKIPVIEGKEPSPPEKKEEWNGRWKVKAKSSTAIEGNQPVVKDWEFEVQTIREGQKIRLIEDREMAFNLSATNPNVATFKEQRKDTIPNGWGDVTDKRVVFLREGKLYLTIQQDITSHTTLPGLPAMVGHAVNSTIGIGDRVK
jgi:hypothetical protein